MFTSWLMLTLDGSDNVFLPLCNLFGRQNYLFPLWPHINWCPVRKIVTTLGISNRGDFIQGIGFNSFGRPDGAKGRRWGNEETVTIGNHYKSWVEENKERGSVARLRRKLTADTMGSRKPCHCQIHYHHCCSCRRPWRAQLVGFVDTFFASGIVYSSRAAATSHSTEDQIVTEAWGYSLLRETEFFKK